MESTSASKYRILKKYTVEDSSQEYYFYPQYRSKLFGWRNIHCEYDYKLYKQSFLSPDVPITTLLLSVLAFVAILFSVAAFLQGFNIIGILLIVFSFIVEYFTLLLSNKYSTFYVKRYTSMIDAKDFIQRKINAIKKRKKSHDTLPDDEVYYLNIQVERKEKLKKINRKFKLF